MCPYLFQQKFLYLVDHLLLPLEPYMYRHALSSKISAAGIMTLSLIPLLGIFTSLSNTSIFRWIMISLLQCFLELKYISAVFIVHYCTRVAYRSNLIGLPVMRRINKFYPKLLMPSCSLSDRFILAFYFYRII